MPDTWRDVSNRFLEEMNDDGYAPAFHTYTEGIFYDRSRPLKERYPAWILRTSWGNSCQFCCQRTRTMEAIPLTQSDAAKAMGIARQVINRLTQLYVKQGRIHVDQDGRIILNKKRNENVVVDPPEKKEWAESMKLFQTYFPQRAIRKQEIRAIVEPLQKELRGIATEELRFHRHRVRSGDNWSAPVTGNLFGSGGGADTHQGDETLPAPVTRAETSHTDSLDPRTRAALNIKQVTKQQQPTPQPTPPALDETELAAAAAKFNEYGMISEANVRAFIVSIGANPADVAAFLSVKGPKINGRNKIAVLRKAITEDLPAFLARRAAPNPAEEKCWSCGGPLVGFAVNGACGECVEAHHAKGAP